MTSRPYAVRLAELGLLWLAAAGLIQAVVFLRGSPVAEFHWALPAGVALIAASVLHGVHRRLAVARPLAMMVFGAIAVRGTFSLAANQFHRVLALDPIGLLGAALVLVSVGLAGWFALSRVAARDFTQV